MAIFTDHSPLALWVDGLDGFVDDLQAAAVRAESRSIRSLRCNRWCDLTCGSLEPRRSCH